jgi:nitrogen fixation protein NifU and related proteins
LTAWRRCRTACLDKLNGAILRLARQSNLQFLRIKEYFLRIKKRHNPVGRDLIDRSNNMAYSDKVLDHYENPRNVGSLDKNDPNVGTGMVGAPACGDVMKLQIKVNDAGVIEDAKFKTYGCGSAIASSSLVTEWLKGKTLDQAQEIKNSAIAEELALPPVKIHCSVLAEDAIKSAIADLKSKQG